MREVATLWPVVVFLATSCGTIVIHALALSAIIQFVRRERRLGRAGVKFWRDVAIVIGAALLALSAHLLEIALWALVFVMCGEFLKFGSAFYESAMNYTSLGYGDVIMSANWKMLGPLEAADGMLMFGVSTGMIFAVVQRLIQTRFSDIER